MPEAACLELLQTWLLTLGAPSAEPPSLPHPADARHRRAGRPNAGTNRSQAGRAEASGPGKGGGRTATWEPDAGPSGQSQGQTGRVISPRTRTRRAALSSVGASQPHTPGTPPQGSRAGGTCWGPQRDPPHTHTPSRLPPRPHSQRSAVPACKAPLLTSCPQPQANSRHPLLAPMPLPTAPPERGWTRTQWTPPALCLHSTEPLLQLDDTTAQGAVLSATPSPPAKATQSHWSPSPDQSPSKALQGRHAAGTRMSCRGCSCSACPLEQKSKVGLKCTQTPPTGLTLSSNLLQRVQD